MKDTPNLVDLEWNPTYRLVPSCFPPTSLFDAVAEADELDAVFEFQALTNPRLRQELGQIHLVPAEDRVVGPGSTPLMAAFCHLNAAGSRFSDGSFGVYYGASTLEAAVAEVSFHRAEFYRHTRQLPIDLDMRSYVANVQKPLHCIRGGGWEGMHAPDDYGSSQALARELKMKGAYGLVYNSVRSPGDQCVAVFRPPAIRVPVVQGAHVTLKWDGKNISGWYEKSSLKPLMV